MFESHVARFALAHQTRMRAVAICVANNIDRAGAVGESGRSIGGGVGKGHDASGKFVVCCNGASDPEVAERGTFHTTKRSGITDGAVQIDGYRVPVAVEVPLESLAAIVQTDNRCDGPAFTAKGDVGGQFIIGGVSRAAINHVGKLSPILSTSNQVRAVFTSITTESLGPSRRKQQHGQNGKCEFFDGKC